jgi:hypothetical protein
MLNTTPCHKFGITNDSRVGGILDALLGTVVVDINMVDGCSGNARINSV